MRKNSVFAGAVKLLAASTPNSPTLLREIVSFLNSDLNSDGGIIAFRPKGPSMEGTAVHQVICSGIRPDPAKYIRVDSDADGRQRVEIAPGRRRPYYVRTEGMSPEGVFVRADGRAVPAGALATARMNRDTYGDVYEKMRSVRQDLTFQEAGTVFARSNCLLTPSTFPSLGITDPVDGEFTNLGYILSDQCPHSLLVRRFGDLRSSEPTSIREIRGSVLRQYMLAARYMNLLSRNTHGELAGVGGHASEYPPEALREALRNVIVHRDYSIEGASFIDVDYTGIEFTATGGLIASLGSEEIPPPATIRNPGLTRILGKLTGTHVPCVRGLLRSYEETGRDPVIDVTPLSFSMYLPTLRPRHSGTHQQHSPKPSHA